MKIENRTELKEYRIECQKKQSADCRVLVCGGTGCLASGSGKIYEKLKELTKDHTGVEVALPVCRPGLFRYKSLRSLPVLL